VSRAKNVRRRAAGMSRTKNVRRGAARMSRAEDARTAGKVSRSQAIHLHILDLPAISSAGQVEVYSTIRLLHTRTLALIS
jgi:hypothetical protein